MPSVNFTYTGSEVSYVVPPNVTSLTCDVVGGEGGDTNNGTTIQRLKGGRLVATLTVTPGETIYLFVGGRGNNAPSATVGGAGGLFGATAGAGGQIGGNGGGGGGGQSYIKRGGTALSNRVLVAGGGGGIRQSATEGGASQQGGHTLDTEAVAALNAISKPDGVNGSGAGGNGGGWRGGQNTSDSFHGHGGTSMYNTTQTTLIGATPGYQVGDGYITILYSTPQTIVQKFFWSANDQDFTAAGEVDIKKFIEAAPGTNSATIASHPSASGTTQITLDPYSTRSTTGDIRANAGWAINRYGGDGMNSVATAKRYIPAGVWTFTMNVAIPAAGALTGSLTVSNIYQVFRVSATGARTALFTATSNTVASGALGAANSGLLTANSASQPAYVLEADETIHVGVISNMVQAAGTLGGTRAGVATYTIGSINEFMQVPAPGVRTMYFNTFTLAGNNSITFPMSISLNRSTTGKGDITSTKNTIASKTFSLIGNGTISSSKFVAASRTFTLQARGTATEQASINKVPYSLTGRGTPTFSKSVIASKSFSLLGTGTASRQNLLVILLSRNLQGKGQITETHPVQAFRTFTIQGRGIIPSQGQNASTVTLPLNGIPEAGGGGTTIVKKILIFDD